MFSGRFSIDNDFRFEKGIEQLLQCEVHAFDPRYIYEQLTPNFNFLSIYSTTGYRGVAGFYARHCSVSRHCDGSACLLSITTPKEGSYSFTTINHEVGWVDLDTAGKGAVTRT